MQHKRTTKKWIQTNRYRCFLTYVTKVRIRKSALNIKHSKHMGILSYNQSKNIIEVIYTMFYLQNLDKLNRIVED